MRACCLVLTLVLAVSASCKAPNEAFCCVTAADCEAHGVTGETRPCDDGLACKGERVRGTVMLDRWLFSGGADL